MQCEVRCEFVGEDMIPSRGGGGVSVAYAHHVDDADFVVSVIYREVNPVVFVDDMSDFPVEVVKI